MPAAKVRIFELAKELGLSSKDLIGLFDKLGLEAKNQLSVVEDPIADLVRGVLLGGNGGTKAPAAPGNGTHASAPAAAPPAAPASAPRRAAKPAPAPVEEPIPTLKPVSSAPRARAKAPAAPEAVAADAPVAASAPVAVEAPSALEGVAPVAAAEPEVVANVSAPAQTPVRAVVEPVAVVAPPAVETAEGVAPTVAQAPAAVEGSPQAPAAVVPETRVAAETPAEAPVAASNDGETPSGDSSPAPRVVSSPAPRIVSGPAPRIVGSPAPRIVGSPAPRIVGSPAPRLAEGPPNAPRPGSVPPRPGAPGIAAGARPPVAPGQRPPGAPGAPVAGMPPRTRPPVTVDTSPVPTLRPVPAGRSTIAQPQRPAPVEGTPPGVAASADPGPQTGLPGRPGVAPRPGQPGFPGQGYQVRPGAPGQVAPGARPGAPGAPGNRRPVGNGPFRPLAPPPGGAGPRPFTPRPGGNSPNPGAPGTQGPTPSSGSGGQRPPAGRGRDREDAAAKKDREKELLLEKERQRKKRGSLDAAPAIQPTVLETIEIPDVLTVQELATSMIIPAKDIIKELIKMGTMATINQNIPAETAQNVARKFGFNAVIKEAGEEVKVEQEEDRPELMTIRPPVVTVLGHVDHGKTSLLDRIRAANVAAGEAGGITQKIGAYTVDKGDRKITFIDTPGHEAFTAMRARGAKVTDVAILVVAADDGVMPQTREAISHIRAAGVPIVVAINKMDKEDAQPDRVKSQLAEEGLQPVDWGGKTEMVPVSARSGMGIDDLLETVLLEADIRDLKANKNRRAAGVVIESALDKGRGAVATVLVQNGTLRVGDVVVVGGSFGKIRALVDDKGKQVKKAGPSIPVEIMGLSEVPSAGDTLMVVSDERVAREAAAKRSTRRKEVNIAASSGPRVSLESFMAMPADGGRKSLNLVLKADGQGAVEALRQRLAGLSNEEVDIRIVLAGVGAITPNDVNLASASNAVLIGFNIRPDETVKRLAENEQVDLRLYNVIYDVENDLKKAMLGMLKPKFREVILGRAEVREVFKVSKVGTIAGCYVQNGKLTRNAKVRILRDNAVIYESELESLRRFKDDVKEVAEGFECGVQVAKFADLKTGDVIEAFASELVAPEAVSA
jgi:translation initiation factor IF-2